MSAPPVGATGTAQASPDRLINVLRSDGRHWTTEEIKARLAKDRSARQTSEQIVQDPIQIPDKETRKALELWKVITARGVAEELNWPRDHQYQLAFPEGFCLRECTPLAAGSAREFGMYGHMAGCADEFVYRMPYEFVPHVLWLLSDCNEHNECPCKPCHRATGRPIVGSFVARLEAEIEALDVNSKDSKAAEPKAVKRPVGRPKKVQVTSTVDAGSKSTTATTPATTTAPATAKATKKATAPKPAPKSKPSQPQSTMSSSLSQRGPIAVQSGSVAATPPARHPSSNDEPTLFRRGEMVWCQQTGPSAGWRIGIVREVHPETDATATTYVIIGLGHSSFEIPDSEREVKHLRPFLTFSVPAISIPDMNQGQFSIINWENVLGNPQNTREMIGLEASKLAALEIDGSWSTFNELPPGPNQLKTVIHYGGVFLGAEMIRLGDPIRHKIKTNETLLEVTEITVTEVASPAPGYQKYELSFRGIEYLPVLVPEKGTIPGQPEGAVFVKDTAFRTLAAKAGGKTLKCVWQTKSLDTVWDEPLVGGRSYATNELLHVTKGEDEVQKAQQTGEFQEASVFLNNRMQTTASLDHGRRPSRWATYSQAVNVARQQLCVGDDIIET